MQPSALTLCALSCSVRPSEQLTQTSRSRASATLVSIRVPALLSSPSSQRRLAIESRASACARPPGADMVQDVPSCKRKRHRGGERGWPRRPSSPLSPAFRTRDRIDARPPYQRLMEAAYEAEERKERDIPQHASSLNGFLLRLSLSLSLSFSHALIAPIPPAVSSHSGTFLGVTVPVKYLSLLVLVLQNSALFLMLRASRTTVSAFAVAPLSLLLLLWAPHRTLVAAGGLVHLSGRERERERRETFLALCGRLTFATCLSALLNEETQTRTFTDTKKCWKSDNLTNR